MLGGGGKCDLNSCKNDATRLCSGCKKVYYCCQDHQKQDWLSHRQVC